MDREVTNRVIRWRLWLSLLLVAATLIFGPPRIYEGSENVALFFFSLPVMTAGVILGLVAVVMALADIAKHYARR
jgi:hypothetical protein